MSVRIQFGGALVRYLKDNSTGNTLRLEISEPQTLSSLITKVGIPAEQPLLVILNSAIVAQDAYSETLIQPNDELSFMPPIQAG